MSGTFYYEAVVLGVLDYSRWVIALGLVTAGIPGWLKANTFQCSVNNCGIEGCIAVSRGGWNPIVNSATARLHGRSIVADSLAEGQTQRSLGQRPRTVDRPITIGWLKANLTKSNRRDWRDSTICRKMGPFEAAQWVDVGLQPTGTTVLNLG